MSRVDTVLCSHGVVHESDVHEETLPCNYISLQHDHAAHIEFTRIISGMAGSLMFPM